jgi:SAM-dependent methyltransferase
MIKQTKENTEYSGLQELLNLEEIKNYNSSIVKESLKNIVSPKNVIDFGAGIGTLSMIFRELSINTKCIEIDEVNKEYLIKRNFSVFDSLSQLKDSADLIFSSNVLEHIEDDLSILKELKKKLSPEGKIFLYLPAKMILWSKMDDVVGHYRRYEINDLKKKCEIAGLKIQSLHYADSIGFFASFAIKLFGYNKNSGIGSLSSLKFYDKWIFPLSKFLDSIGFKYLLGKNLILIASKN